MRRNLLFITTYTGLGGGETSLLTQVEHLDRARYHPQLLVPGDGQLAERWRALGGTVQLHQWRGASTWFVPAIWSHFPIARHIEGIIRRDKIALIHSDYHSLPFALPAARRAGIPCIWTCWGWWFHPRHWQRGYFMKPEATIAASWAIREGFLGDPPFMPPERVEVIPPGVDTARFHPALDGGSVRDKAGIAHDAPLVALIARFQDVKGHDVFQEMAKIVAGQIPDARFVVAGENTHTSADDAYKRRILDHAQTDPTLRETLTYLGFRADVERVIAAADVVVCSSDFESYGMVNVEAMASGKPVVSTRRGGPSETVVDGETGFLVDPRNPAALATQVIRLLRDPALRARMGAAGRAQVEAKFAAAVTAARFQAQIDRLLEGKR
jgi:glycosyltransferase involved in cell wall biosynthesis